MKKQTTDWIRNDFKAYLLLFCANANITETQEEKELIINKVNKKTYKRIHREFDNDNDFQCLQKIQQAARRLKYSSKQIQQLMDEIKELFLSDGKFDHIENSILIQIKRVLD